MKFVQKYNSFINENISKNDFYLLFGDLVRVDYIDYNYGDQIKVLYTKKDGIKHSYIGDNQKEFDEDFLETNDSFNEVENLIISKPINNDKYNVVYYIGKNKIETIANNIDYKLANILKRTNSKNPNYKKGRIIIETIK